MHRVYKFKDLMAKLGITHSYDGMAVVWSDAGIAKKNPAAAKRASDACLEDEKKFLDLPSSYYFRCKCEFSAGPARRPSKL